MKSCTACKVIAIVGARTMMVRPSYFVMQYLIDKGYDVIPVNPGLAGKDDPRAAGFMGR